MVRLHKLVPVSVTLLLCACATVPVGPSVMVLPGAGKSFETFRQDDATCNQFAFEAIGGQAAYQSANDAGVATAVVGTAVGAAAGGLIGGQNGAAVGAGTGLLLGSAAGAGSAGTSIYATQQRYDARYIQCMYAKGHRVPVYGRFEMEPARSSTPPPPPPGTGYPPPATRYPPPPPTGSHPAAQ